MTGIFFDGQLRVTPSVLTKVNDSGLLPTAPSVGNIACVIGHSAGGAPQTVMTFGSPADAVATLASGDLLDAVIRAFNPSVDTGGPQAVLALRIDPAVQSALNLLDGTSAQVINLASTGYGLRENQIKVKVEAATGGRGFKLTTQRGAAFYAQDNVYRNAFSIQYTGAAASAVMTISNTTLTLQAPSGTPVATIDLNVYSTIAQVVDRINTTAGFAAAILDGNDSKPALNALDSVTAQDVKTALYTAKADLQAVVDWFNGAGEGYITATRVSGAGTLPAALPFTYLTGGSDGTATNTDWTNGFAVLQTAEFQWLTPCSNDPAIHAMADAHVQYMSTTGRKERRAICGAPLATSDVAAIALAKNINSDRTSLVHLGGFDFDLNGALTLYQPFVVAAMIAGAFAGVNPGTPLTAKSLRLQGLERKLRNPTDTDGLLLGGVLPLEATSTGYRIVQSISTWLTNAKYNRREQSVGAALDYALRSLRAALQPIKGAKGTPQTLSLAFTLAETCLRGLAVPEPAGPGILAGDANNPAFIGLTATLSGESVQIGVQMSPVIPVNYIPIVVNAVPFSGTVSASS
jgi:hypothetical protein